MTGTVTVTPERMRRTLRLNRDRTLAKCYSVMRDWHVRSMRHRADVAYSQIRCVMLSDLAGTNRSLIVSWYEADLPPGSGVRIIPAEDYRLPR
jgi:hypothetical protein